MSDTELDRLLGSDEDFLLDRLATALLGEVGLGIGSDDTGDRRRFANRWLNEKLSELRPVLCGRASLQKALTGDRAAILLEAAAIIDIVSAKTNMDSAGAATVLAIVATRGYDWLCG